MKKNFGVLGVLSSESKEEKLDAVTPLTIGEQVAADEAYMEATEIAHESHMDVVAMEQAITIGEQLEAHIDLASTLAGNPEQVTAGVATMAREAMSLALRALGSDGESQYSVSVESALAAPVEALEVSIEGYKDVTKKIVDGIKMIFAKIVVNIKKLIVKLVLVMDRTSSKAAELLAEFKANKDFVADDMLTEEEATSIYNRIGGTLYLISKKFASAAETAGNIEVLRAYDSGVLADLAKLQTAVAKIEEGTDGEKVLAALAEGGYTSVKYQVASEAAKTGKAGVSKLDVSSKLKELELTSDQVKELGLGEDALESTVHFFPTYASGNTIHGVVFYANKMVEEDAKDPAALIACVKSQAGSVTAYDEGQIKDMAKKAKVRDRANIEAELGGLKDASKLLKAFAEARLKDVDAATKEIENAAKAESGSALLNRIAGTEFNRTRMFIASNYISTIFALASGNKALLARAATHIGHYKAPAAAE